MINIDNAIEIAYRKLIDEINNEYDELYVNVQHKKLKIIFSTLHSKMLFLFDRMNSRLPTLDNSVYFWAEESRELIKCIDIISQLQKSLSDSALAFNVDSYYKIILDTCSDFLCQYRGSEIPPHTEKIELYYKIPIFQPININVQPDVPEIKTIDREYIANIAKRSQEDIEKGYYDSAITKSRTLLEETFCYVIELQNNEPSDSGDIGRLYNQVKQLYNMHQDRNMDRRINMLLSGLEKILSAISQMRNEGSDSHGVGQRRIRISEHHTRLFVNSAMTMADFILSIGENQKNIADTEQEEN
jgi:flagellin-specific chaperone FliS